MNQYDIETGEKECIFENHFQDGNGCILSEDYMVEYGYATASEPAKLKVYNGSEWLDVELPEEVLKAQQSKTPFFPTSIASDRMFFKMNILDEGRGVAVGTNLYYIMLEEETPKLVFAGNLGKSVESQKPTIEQEDVSQDVYANFEEVTVFESEDYSFKVTDIYFNEAKGTKYVCVKFVFENRSEDKTYDIHGNDWTINGIQCTTLWGASDIEPNKTVTDVVALREGVGKALGQCKISEFYGIDEYTDIQMGLHLFEKSEEEGSKEIEQTFLHIYPQGEDKAITFTREPQDTDIELVNNEKVSVVITGYEQRFVPNDTVRVLITNKTDNYIQVKVDEAAANGISKEKTYINDCFYDVILNPGAVGAYPMSLFDGQFEDSYRGYPSDAFFKANGIESIEEIKMNLRIYPCDYGHGAIREDIVNQVFVLNP